MSGLFTTKLYFTNLPYIKLDTQYSALPSSREMYSKVFLVQGPKLYIVRGLNIDFVVKLILYACHKAYQPSERCKRQG